MVAVNLTLSVLDQSPVPAGGDPVEAIRQSVQLAVECERLGYHRYWVAEHHSAPGLAGAAPEILIARIAAATHSMRVGSGGVMLPHYSPYKVAEQFRVLEALYPGRIDLGVGRAPGSDKATSVAINYKSAAGGGGFLDIQHFPQQIVDLRGFLTDDHDDNHPFKQVKAMPTGPTTPDIWLLGSSDQSARAAAHFGLPFSFAHFISAQGGVAAVNLYRDSYEPSEAHPAAQANVGVFVLCADTEEEAEQLALSRDLWRLRLDRGEIGPIPSPEEAAAASLAWSSAELRRVQHNRQRQIVGTPPQVHQQLLDLAQTYGVQELVVVTICHDFTARLRSYDLLADAFGLNAKAA